MGVTNISLANYCSWKQFALFVRRMSVKVPLILLKQVGDFIIFFKPQVFMKTEKWLLTSHLEFKTSEFKSPAWKILSFLFIIWFSQYDFFLKYKLFCSMFLRENKIYHFFWPMISSIHIVSKIVVSKPLIYSNICPCFKKTIFPPLFQLPSLRSEEKW